MKLDSTFVKELKKQANGDGSREAMFAFYKKAKAAAHEMSTPDVKYNFAEMVKKYGRVTALVCVAGTIIWRGDDRFDPKWGHWAREVLNLWTNCPPNPFPHIIIADNLHPTTIFVYAGEAIRLSCEEW